MPRARPQLVRSRQSCDARYASSLANNREFLGGDSVSRSFGELRSEEFQSSP